MAQVTGQAEQAGDTTRGERLAGLAGIVCGLLITAVCIDLASGGRITAALARGRGTTLAAAAGDDAPGGCPGGCP